MKNKIIAFSNNFMLNAIESFFERYKLVVENIVDEGIKYSVYDKEDNPLFENGIEDLYNKSIIEIFLQEENSFLVGTFYPNLIYQANYKKGDSVAVFYITIAHFVKHFSLPSNVSGKLICDDNVFEKFYKKMKDLKFIEVHKYKSINMKRYNFLIPSFFIDTSKVEEDKTIYINKVERLY